MSRARDTANQINRVNSSAADATALTVDSSENVLVGTTSTDQSIAGHGFKPDGFAYHTRNGGAMLRLNRLTSDGDLMQIQKDGTTVGSVGNKSDDLIIHTTTANHSGLRFGEGYIFPVDNTGNTSDGVHDLGLSVGRYKDFYLSGGIHLGGVGSANKLDDYEEGTWTPTGEGITYAQAFGSYVKVGRMVMVTYNITFPSTGNTGGAQINSLPFSATVGNAYQSGGYITASSGGSAVETLFLTVATNRLIFRDSGNNNKNNNEFSQDFIQGSAVYTTD